VPTPLASEVRTCPGCGPPVICKPVIFTVPATSSRALGVVVPMPTLPVRVTFRYSLSGMMKPSIGIELVATHSSVAKSTIFCAHANSFVSAAPEPGPDAPTASSMKRGAAIGCKPRSTRAASTVAGSGSIASVGSAPSPSSISPNRPSE
jgi:hypothetical protein